MKRLLALAMTLLLLTGCSPAPQADGRLHILCTTYPIYLFTTAVVGETDRVSVELLVDQQTSCLHDYTLSVKDMRAIDRADVIVMNGVGLEAFLDDALSQKKVPVIDCSAGIELLEAADHHHHDGEAEEEHEEDPHLWMDPRRAMDMVRTVMDGLSGLDPDHAEGYLANGAEALEAMSRIDPMALDVAFPPYPLITFHDGFQYFARSYGFALLKAIEEEEGAEASAQELKELIELVKDRRIPAIFVEKNGSRRSAEVIAGETGCKVFELDMIMSGSDTGIQPYLDAMTNNLLTVLEAME